LEECAPADAEPEEAAAEDEGPLEGSLAVPLPADLPALPADLPALPAALPLVLMVVAPCRLALAEAVAAANRAPDAAAPEEEEEDVEPEEAPAGPGVKPEDAEEAAPEAAAAVCAIVAAAATAAALLDLALGAELSTRQRGQTKGASCGRTRFFRSLKSAQTWWNHPAHWSHCTQASACTSSFLRLERRDLMAAAKMAAYERRLGAA
jgi:hypothetical protein